MALKIYYIYNVRWYKNSKGDFILKLNKIIFAGILLLVSLSLAAVCASDYQTSDLDSDDGDFNSVQSEINDDILTGDMQIVTIDDGKLSTSKENILGEDENLDDNIVVCECETPSLGGLDNLNVRVSNVFKGQEMTIFITASKATGAVNITVGDKTYTTEFVSGIAKQSISEYNIGINNVTVMYKDIVKETSFKGLDGVITNENFDDYFEIDDYNYCLRSFIPEYITLDIRGYLDYGMCITKSCNLISTTYDAVIKGGVSIQSDASGSNISNMKSNGLGILASNCNVVNVTTSSISCLGDNFRLENSQIGNLQIQSNVVIINCTINNPWEQKYRDVFSNVKIFNSTFNNGIVLRTVGNWLYNSYLTIVGCVINGQARLDHVDNCLIENNSIHGHLLVKGANSIVKNNFINASSSRIAIELSPGQRDDYNKIINNRIYSKYYCGINAISYENLNLSFGSYLSNVFENNTPTQIDLNVDVVSDTIFYDENTTVLVNMPGIKGKVVFRLNDEVISVVELVNGTATQILDKYIVGINNVSVTYEDLVNDIYAVNHTSVKVNQVDYCPVNLAYDNVVEGKTFLVNVILPDDANGNITLVLKNGTHSITIKEVANGTNNVIGMFSLFEGNYTISATFESVKYVTNFTVVNICVVHVPVYTLTASDVVMDYKDGSKYRVLVTKDGETVVGEVVKVTFNGKTVEVKTDEDGYATLALDAAPKTYVITAQYNGVTKSNKVTIKSLLKASNVSKKKAKNIKFSATLKTSKGKAITGKKITFKFKGKTYTAKTNKKGIATVTLKNLKVGKYSITSKYGACTVKNTIKIKK